MTLANCTIVAGFNLPVTSATAFVLDDPVAGLLDSVVYGLDDPSTDVSSYASAVKIQRGRNDQIWDVINAGTATITFQNYDRRFDPTNTAGPYYGAIVPGVAITIAVDSVSVFTGRVRDWNFDYDIDGMSIATAVCVDALGVLGAQQFDDWTATVGQLSGARISAVLDRPEVDWNAGARSIAAGNTTLQGDNVAWGSNVLNYCQLVTESELGYFYADRLGVLTFADRFTGFNVAPTISFDDTHTNIPFNGIVTSYGSEQLFNRVGVDPAGLTVQTATDTTSAATYGYLSLTLNNLLMDSEAQAADMADYLVGLYAQPTFRVAQLDVKLHGLTAAQRALMLVVDITSVASLAWTPNRVGSALSVTSIVQGIDHEIGLDNHTMSLHLSNASNTTIFTLDDDTYGLLDGNSLIGF